MTTLRLTKASYFLATNVSQSTLSKLKFYLSLGLYLAGFYLLVNLLFFRQLPATANTPLLKTRLGTILWHSNDYLGGNTNLYCYYPSGSVTYPDRGGEYIIKKVQNLTDCQGWFGATFYSEPKWVSEEDKVVIRPTPRPEIASIRNRDRDELLERGTISK